MMMMMRMMMKRRRDLGRRSVRERRDEADAEMEGELGGEIRREPIKEAEGARVAPNGTANAEQERIR